MLKTQQMQKIGCSGVKCGMLRPWSDLVTTLACIFLSRANALAKTVSEAMSRTSKGCASAMHLKAADLLWLSQTGREGPSDDSLL